MTAIYTLETLQETRSEICIVKYCLQNILLAFVLKFPITCVFHILFISLALCFSDVHFV
jgi:hypothetical protein